MGLSSRGSWRILTVSGGTAEKKRYQICPGIFLSHLQYTFMVIVSNRGISVAEFAASHLYLASLSVTLVKIVISAVTDLSVVLVTELICKNTN